MSNAIPPAKIPSVELRGGCFMLVASASSIPSAIAGKLSVIRFIHSR